MWDQPTEPTLVGAPVGHPDGSFGGLGTAAPSGGFWTAAGNGQAPRPSAPQTGAGGWATKPPQQAGQWTAAQPAVQQQPAGTKNSLTAAPSGWGEPMPTTAGHHHAPAGATGWGVPAASAGHHPAAAAMWNGVGASSSQWDSTGPSTGTNSSWSQIASKNVPPAASRPKPAGNGPYDGTVNQAPVSAGWGSHNIDQGTPWGADSNVKSKDWHSATGGPAPITPSGWGDGKDAAIPTQPQQQQQMAGSWQTAAASKDKVDQMGTAASGCGYWKDPTSSHGPSSSSTGGRTPSTSNSQWGTPAEHHVTSGSGWDSLPPQSSRSWNHSEPVTPSNVWTGPPTDGGVDNSMVWNNPNPKKVAQPDKGTNCWGDPTSQNEIRRWKTAATDENIITTPAAAAAAGLSSMSTAATASSSVWKETPIAPLKAPQAAATSVPAWTTSTAAPTSSVGSGGSDKASTGPAGNVWDGAANKSAPSGLAGWTPTATDLGWGAPPKTLDLQARSSAENDNTNDDVFSSNPTTPLNQKNGLNTNYQRMAQSTQQPTGGKILQNMQVMANTQQVEMLTSKISDQLKAACAAGLIDKSVLYNHLPQETLVRLYYLLQYLPKLEQAQRELHSLRSQVGQPVNEAQNQEIRRLTNEVHQYQATIQTMKVQINAQIAQLDKNAPSAAVQLPNSNVPPASMLRPASSINVTGMTAATAAKDAIPVSPGNMAAGGGDSLNQSKLLQWKNANGASSSMTSGGTTDDGSAVGTDKSKSSMTLATVTVTTAASVVSSPSTSNLESLVHSMASATLSSLVNDTWAPPSGQLPTAVSEQPHDSKRESTPSSAGGWPPKTADGSTKNDDSSGTSQDTLARNTPTESATGKEPSPPSTTVSDVVGLQPRSATVHGSQFSSMATSQFAAQRMDTAGDVRPFGMPRLSSMHGGGLDEGPPEFRPGQKWLWKDPKEMAEDPNATPGSVKTNTLTLNTNVNSMGPTAATHHPMPLGSAFGAFSAHHSHGGYSAVAAALQQQHFGVAGGYQQPPFGAGAHLPPQHGMAAGGWLGQQTQPPLQHHHPQSLFGGAAGPHGRMTDDYKMKPQGAADFFTASRLGSATGVGRLPPAALGGQMGSGGAGGQSPFAARPPLIKQQFSMPNAFVPYAGVGQQQQQQWIVFTITNLSQIDEHTLQILVNNHGTTQTYISPPGSGVAFVKFRDVPLDRVLSKMQQEFTPLGITIQMTKDSEVERLLQAFNAAGGRQSAQPPLFGGAPRHGLWDAPPPLVAPWATAGGAGGPPPHPYGAPPPSITPMGAADHMAQLLQQQQSQPMLHDALMHDRHPF